ncbi:hypothetical protein [Actinomadura sp. 6K520]|uniref:hypothetical protein n=1 Tax=Actinomadura sp. 6K520 TaxID=2530364 RepID=UPI00105126B6|nr:hypothetical protein [Actinomadura sp. 6K520]TDE28586.1 hypothetical protein E1289_21665 [Actinomadura sp. 6K520]
MSVAALLEARADDGRPGLRRAGGDRALAAGAELVLRTRFSASAVLPDVRAHGCTYLHYVGKALSYRRLTAEDAAGFRAEFAKRGRLHLLERSG